MLSAFYKSEIPDSDKNINNFDMKLYDEYIIIISDLFDISEIFYVCFWYRHMTGNDNEGSHSVYGSDVEIVTSSSATPTSMTASNKVRSHTVHL